MHDPKLIEAMARAIGARLALRGSVNDAATDALRDLCAAHPGVAAVLRGEAVALPKTPTDAQWDHIAASLDAHPASLLMERQRRWWPDFIAASPYAQNTPDAR